MHQYCQNALVVFLVCRQMQLPGKYKWNEWVYTCYYSAHSACLLTGSSFSSGHIQNVKSVTA